MDFTPYSNENYKKVFFYIKYKRLKIIVQIYPK